MAVDIVGPLKRAKSGNRYSYKILWVRMYAHCVSLLFLAIYVLFSGEATAVNVFIGDTSTGANRGAAGTSLK